MKTEMEKFLFQKLFRNKVFSLLYDLQELEQLYIYLVSAESITLVDKYGIVYNQMELASRDLKALQELIDRNITPVFREKEKQNEMD